MIPRLFEEDELYFSGQGLGGLSEARSCRVDWSMNGYYTLTVEYPVTGRRFEDLTDRRIILASVGPDEQAQPFRIEEITAPLMGICTIKANHISYDLMGHTIVPFQAEGLDAALEQLQGSAMVDSHGFTLAADKESSTACSVLTPRSVWSMLGGQRGSLLDVYGGEWDFDRRTATLRERLGQDLGVLVRYGKNLQTLEQNRNLANCWTYVQPYWLSSDETQLVTLPEVKLSTGEFDYIRGLVLDLSAEWPEAPTEEELRSRTKKYISDNDVGVPAVGLDVSFVPLTQTEEYKDRAFLQDIHKGDTVSVEFPTSWNRTTGAPKSFVRATARAVEYVWLPMENKYASVRLGRARSNFASVLAQVEKNVDWLMTKVGR